MQITRLWKSNKLFWGEWASCPEDTSVFHSSVMLNYITWWTLSLKFHNNIKHSTQLQRGWFLCQSSRTIVFLYNFPSKTFSLQQKHITDLKACLFHFNSSYFMLLYTVTDSFITNLPGLQLNIINGHYGPRLEARFNLGLVIYHLSKQRGGMGSNHWKIHKYSIIYEISL